MRLRFGLPCLRLLKVCRILVELVLMKFFKFLKFRSEEDGFCAWCRMKWMTSNSYITIAKYQEMDNLVSENSISSRKIHNSKSSLNNDGDSGLRRRSASASQLFNPTLGNVSERDVRYINIKKSAAHA